MPWKSVTSWASNSDLSPAYWRARRWRFVLLLTFLYDSAYNILFWYREDTPAPQRTWEGLAAAAHD
jgi:hypothetical protein